MSRPKRSQEELKRACYHIWFSWSMFDAYLQLVTTGEYKSVTVLHNALVEAFCAQTRNLLDFFYPTKPTADDASAFDFYDNRKIWRQQRPALTTELRKMRHIARREAGHMTYKKIKATPSRERWHTLVILLEMQAVMRVFVQTASPGRLDFPLTSSEFQDSLFHLSVH